MTDRQPYVRAIVDNEQMNLPDGKTCGDCVHYHRCCAIYGRIPADGVCDWSPSRFREAKPMEISNDNQ